MPAGPTSVVASQAFELALDPPNGGLVIGVSHEGATAATIDAMDAAGDAGAHVGLITGSDHSPAGDTADEELIVETVEMDHGWCHTIGYVAPIVATAAIGAQLSGSPLDAVAVRELLADGARDEAGAEAIEVHLATPDPFVEQPQMIYENVPLAARILHRVRTTVTIPVLAKLGPFKTPRLLHDTATRLAPWANGYVLVHGAGVGQLFRHAHIREKFQDQMGLHLQLSRKNVNTDLLHKQTKCKRGDS